MHVGFASCNKDNVIMSIGDNSRLVSTNRKRREREVAIRSLTKVPHGDLEHELHGIGIAIASPKARFWASWGRGGIWPRDLGSSEIVSDLSSLPSTLFIAETKIFTKVPLQWCLDLRGIWEIFCLHLTPWSFSMISRRYLWSQHEMYYDDIMVVQDHNSWTKREIEPKQVGPQPGSWHQNPFTTVALFDTICYFVALFSMFSPGLALGLAPS